MRVGGGEARGRKIRTPRGRTARPTSDRVKKTIFDILGPRIIGARVLDLFAGSGALGIEALSRGASGAVFVESDPGAVRAIRENIEHCRVGPGAEIFKGRADAALRSMRKAGVLFDLIFVDPPYDLGMARAALELLSSGRVLDEGACIVVEWSRDERSDSPEASLVLENEREFGRTIITFFRYSARPEGDRASRHKETVPVEKG